MPSGAGKTGAGLTPAGIGAPDVAASPVAGVIFEDSRDGIQKDARQIDQRSRQYVFGSDGRIQGMRGVYQMVQLRCMTLRNSSAIANFGLSIASVQVIGTNHQRQVEDIFNVAMRDLIDQRVIQIVSIQVERFSKSGDYITFKWRDLTQVPAVEFSSRV